MSSSNCCSCDKKNLSKDEIGLNKKLLGKEVKLAKDVIGEDAKKLTNELQAGEVVLLENVRFLMCLFRAKCDLLVKLRRVTEQRLIKKAKSALKNMQTDVAKDILTTSFNDEYNELRNEIWKMACRGSWIPACNRLCHWICSISGRYLDHNRGSWSRIYRRTGCGTCDSRIYCLLVHSCRKEVKDGVCS